MNALFMVPRFLTYLIPSLTSRRKDRVRAKYTYSRAPDISNALRRTNTQIYPVALYYKVAFTHHDLRLLLDVLGSPPDYVRDHVR